MRWTKRIHSINITSNEEGVSKVRMLSACSAKVIGIDDGDRRVTVRGKGMGPKRLAKPNEVTESNPQPIDHDKEDPFGSSQGLYLREFLAI